MLRYPLLFRLCRPGVYSLGRHRAAEENLLEPKEWSGRTLAPLRAGSTAMLLGTDDG